MSLTGGMDLSKLKTPASSQVTSLKVPSFVTQVTESTLPSLVKVSGTVPVILEFFADAPDSVLEQVVRAKGGKLMLARVNAATDVRVAQAFGVKSSPSLFALVKGQPVPVAEGPLNEGQYLAIADQLIAGAAAQGVAGQLVEGDVADVVPELPKPLQEALALVDGGEVDKAFELLTKLKAENPKDAPTSALLAQVNLMKRTMDCDHEAILASQPTTFEEAIVLADVLIAIGDFASGFEIMLSLYPQVQPENKEIIKARMLEYFEIGGPNDQNVKSARARLATLLY
jgi:putative thioredoxin